jgi:biotin transport system substrate-specific component
VLYLLEGAAGLPVFAGTPERGIGLVYMAGPTGGYLAGFVAAAWLAGVAAERGWARTIATRTVTIGAGLTIIYILGAAWLSTSMGAVAALKAGVLPFLLGDAIKLGLGVAILQAVGFARTTMEDR